MEEIEIRVRPTDDNRYIVLIIYDITDNKRRLSMVRCLEQFAVRVQKSAFEGFLTLKQYECISELASRIINAEEDSLRIYILYDHTRVRSWGIGDIKEDDVIIY